MVEVVASACLRQSLHGVHYLDRPMQGEQAHAAFICAVCASVGTCGMAQNSKNLDDASHGLTLCFMTSVHEEGKRIYAFGGSWCNSRT